MDGPRGTYRAVSFVETRSCWFADCQHFTFGHFTSQVINDTGYGRKSDIWSVGCTVFEMATGKPPLAHMDKMAALFYIGAERGEMPSLPEKFSNEAKNFVQTCLTRYDQSVDFKACRSICSLCAHTHLEIILFGFVSSDQSLRPSADQLLEHPFVHQNKSRETLRNCCGHPQCV